MGVVDYSGYSGLRCPFLMRETVFQRSSGLDDMSFGLLSVCCWFWWWLFIPPITWCPILKDWCTRSAGWAEWHRQSWWTTGIYRWSHPLQSWTFGASPWCCIQSMPIFRSKWIGTIVFWSRTNGSYPFSAWYSFLPFLLFPNSQSFCCLLLLSSLLCLNTSI